MSGNADSCWAADNTAKSSWDHAHSMAISVGDNVLDFPCMNQNDARGTAATMPMWGSEYFLVPNPLYGSWDKNAVALPAAESP
jgi:predicted secreted acid phosphatase